MFRGRVPAFQMGVVWWFEVLDSFPTTVDQLLDTVMVRLMFGGIISQNFQSRKQMIFPQLLQDIVIEAHVPFGGA